MNVAIYAVTWCLWAIFLTVVLAVFGYWHALAMAIAATVWAGLAGDAYGGRSR